jgi:hypothetical protein
MAGCSLPSKGFSGAPILGVLFSGKQASFPEKNFLVR